LPATATTGPTDTPDPTDTPAATATTGPVLITYRNYEIVPASTTIKAGTAVTFVIEGDLHQPYAGAAAPFIFEAPNNLQNTTWTITFNTPRTMTILCGYHANMNAQLIVEP
jgi:plastocyanin